MIPSAVQHASETCVIVSLLDGFSASVEEPLLGGASNSAEQLFFPVPTGQHVPDIAVERVPCTYPVRGVADE